MILPDLYESKEIYVDRYIKYLMAECDFTSLQADILSNTSWNESTNQSHEIIDISSTYKIINEVLLPVIAAAALVKSLRKSSDSKKKINDEKGDVKNNIGSISGLLIKGDDQSNSNKIFPRPSGIIISDTFNNPFFPINFPRIDTSKFNLPEVSSRFHEDYTGMKLDYLPWHFTVEFIQSQYYIFNTRPLDMKFPITTIDGQNIIDTNSVKLNDKTQDFFKIKPFNLNEAIHIAIIGDSYKDVYIQHLYEILGRNCIGPILRYFKLAPSIWTKVWALNMGPKFKPSLLEQHLKR